MTKNSHELQGSSRGGVKSAERTLSIVEWIARKGPQRFDELVEALELPRSSAHALLRTLCSAQWLIKHADRRFDLGIRSWEVGRQYTGHEGYLEVAETLMHQLSKELKETVQLARLDGVHNIYVAISHSSHPMRLASSVGVRLPAHGTAIGKALLAQLAPEETAGRIRGQVLEPMTEHTIVDEGELLAELARVREHGYGTDVEEYAEGCICVAVPVGIDPESNEPIALSVTAPTNRRPPGWPTPFLDPLLRTAAELSGRLKSKAL